MTRRQERQQTKIAPHYQLVQKEFIRLRAKLEVVMVCPATKPMGREIIDAKAALIIWEKSLRKTAKRLPPFFHSFSATILARSRRPCRIKTLQAIIPLEQGINQLTALHRQLWQQPLGGKWHEGQVLLSRCIKKITADLVELFSFFISTVEAYSFGLKAKKRTYLWDKEIACQLEMAEYRSWKKSMPCPSFLSEIINSFPGTIHGVVSRSGAKCSILCKA
ncbi:MAG: hypothetical protein ABFS09_09075 [Thermodesulfobacteriota bacterium]